MIQILKYLFFLVLGIIIYILLNDKDRFSIGIPEGGDVRVLDFLPVSWRNYLEISNVAVSLPHHPKNIYKIYDEVEEETETLKITKKFIRYSGFTVPKSRVQSGPNPIPPTIFEFGIKITKNKTTCASCKDCCDIKILNSPPSSILDFLEFYRLPVPILHGGDALLVSNMVNDASNRDKLFLNKPLLFTNIGLGTSWRLISVDKMMVLAQHTVLADRQMREYDSYRVLREKLLELFDIMDPREGEPSAIYQNLIFLYNIDRMEGALADQKMRNAGVNISNQNMSELFSDDSGKWWATKWDPFQDREFWNGLIYDLSLDTDCTKMDNEGTELVTYAHLDHISTD